MIDSILLDEFHVIEMETSNDPFRSSIEYSEYEESHKHCITLWKGLTKSERAAHKNLVNFMISNGLGYNRSEIEKVKSKYTFEKEAEARVLTPIDVISLPINRIDYEQTLYELVENLENIEHIKNVYKLRNKNIGDTTNAGLTSEESNKLRNCLKQGRELFLAGKGGALMVKPLNLFYALTAYSYAAIILNHPIRNKIDQLPKSHGVSFKKDDPLVTFGGDIPGGTFTELVCSSPTIYHKCKNIDIVLNNTKTAYLLYKNKISIGMGTLLSLIPEIRDFYKLVTGRNSRTYPLYASLSNNPRNTCWEFQIGDGNSLPQEDHIQRDFSGFTIKTQYGKYIIDVPTTEVHKVSTCIIMGTTGEFWYVDNPIHPCILTEMAIHFLTSFAYSNIMRYSPDSWGALLSNDASSDVSLITRKYISALENKFIFMVLNNVSRFFPYMI